MWNAAKLGAKDKPAFARDSMLNDAVVTLSEIDLKLKKKDDAIADLLTEKRNKDSEPGDRKSGERGSG